ncbi:CBL-interacting serine/threonine-protein kinase 20-like [Abrus precatorius]|uniref:non-specific serine/threonine protein kinase n=1 Tax=Abrus precatorius TaxID=3816 RepID=A0A8B8K310_ABRPR|nr:CBL-interacting serine/threonine-protein kinase 20-like [Abrus precatorius]
MENKATILMQGYEVGRLLGQGNFGKVYHARNLKTGQSVAIKVINKEKVMRGGMKDQIKREISVMRLVKHPNIVQVYEVMASKTKIYFAMEWVKGGELFHKVSQGRLREEMARKYFQQLIDTVDHCHSRGVYHRDLKPENLLLDENGDLKVSDFGLSALLESKKKDGLLHTTCGTPAYVAPEVIKKKGYDGAKADIWSCGVILYVLLAGFLPFNDKNLVEMYKKISKADFKFPRWFSSDVKRLLYRILDPNPRTRISISKIVQSNWFRKGYMQIEAPRLPPLSPTNGEDISDVQAAFSSSGLDSDDSSKSDNDQSLMKPYHFNAFDIISLSSGLDLSGLFEKDNNERQAARFTTRKPLSIILSKLEDVAQVDGRFNVIKKNGIVILKENKTPMRNQLIIEAEIFEVTSSFHIVEVKKIDGDTLAYWRFWNRYLKPSLNEIVWTWQGYEQQQL